MRFLKSALKGIGGLLACWLLLGFICLIYSSVWEEPHAKQASAMFEQSVKPGMSEDKIRSIATRLGASDILSAPETATSEQEVYVSFYTFPGGIARYLCPVHFSKSLAKQTTCGFRG